MRKYISIFTIFTVLVLVLPAIAIAGGSTPAAPPTANFGHAETSVWRTFGTTPGGGESGGHSLGSFKGEGGSLVDGNAVANVTTKGNTNALGNPWSKATTSSTGSINNGTGEVKVEGEGGQATWRNHEVDTENWASGGGSSGFTYEGKATGTGTAGGCGGGKICSGETLPGSLSVSGGGAAIGRTSVKETANALSARTYNQAEAGTTAPGGTWAVQGTGGVDVQKYSTTPTGATGPEVTQLGAAGATFSYTGEKPAGPLFGEACATVVFRTETTGNGLSSTVKAFSGSQTGAVPQD